MKMALVLIATIASADVCADENVFTIPSRAWGLSFETPPLEHYTAKADENYFGLSGGSKNGFLFAVFVNPSFTKSSSKNECRKLFLENLGENPDIVRDSYEFFEKHTFVGVRYKMRIRGHAKPSMSYYDYRDGECIEIHVTPGALQSGWHKELDSFNASLDYYSR